MWLLEASLPSGTHYTNDFSIMITIYLDFITFYSYLNSIQLIAIKICTCHESYAVMACAKLYGDVVIRKWMKIRWNCYQIWMKMEKILGEMGWCGTAGKCIGLDWRPTSRWYPIGPHSTSDQRHVEQPVKFDVFARHRRSLLFLRKYDFVFTVWRSVSREMTICMNDKQHSVNDNMIMLCS